MRGGEYQDPTGRVNDLRIRLLRYYVLFAGVILLCVLLLAYFANKRLEGEVWASHLSLARTMANQIERPLAAQTDLEEQIGAWLALAGIDEVILTISDLNTSPVVRFQNDVSIPVSPDWNVWQREAIRTAFAAESGNFYSRDPATQRWFHTFVTLPDSDQRLMVQRPARSAFTATNTLIQGLLVALGIYFAGGVFSWLLLTRQVIKPLEQLEAFSGIIRWRGKTHPQEQAEIDLLAGRNDQIGSLARSLIVMHDETEKRLVQLATLLETSQVVASSLDVTEVIDRILDQVQTLFKVDRCAVVALDRRAGTFRMRASRGISPDYAEQLRIDPSEPNSASMRALRNETPIQISDTEMDLAYASFRPRAREEGFRSVLAIPLRTSYAQPAVLLLYKADPYRYSYSELELASSFGNHASVAMENAALYELTDEKLREQTRRLEAIVESLDDGLVLESESGQVLYCNRQALRWLALSRKQAEQKSAAQLMQLLLERTDDPRTALEAISAGNGEPSRQEDSIYLPPLPVNGPKRSVDIRIHLFNVTDAHGELLGRGQLWQDVTREKELDRMKSALLSTVSHELRTPLATIKGYASTLLASDVKWDEKSQHEFLKIISLESDRLAKLVKNLLDMSRIEADMLVINREPYSLNELLLQVIDGYPRVGGGLPLENRLRKNLAHDLPPVWIDVSRMDTVIRNYLDNAVKYSADDSPIELATRQDNGQVILTVRDHGPGIPEELKEKVFDRFVRADNRLTRQVGGTGLGLAICKAFVEAHNGRVWARSETKQSGALFGFSLPVETKNED